MRDEDWAIIVAGLFAFLRAWFHYNFYLLKDNEPSFKNVITFINNDKKLFARYWNILPILEKAISVKSSRVKVAANICFIFAWLAIILFVIFSFSKRNLF